VVNGWAVQRAAQAFATLADTDYCVSAGGDMVCRVADADRPAWRIGIEDPHRPSRVVAVVPLRTGALATYE
jgi:FAD:protein FMN transferase